MLNGATIDRVDDFVRTLRAYEQVPEPRIARLVADPGMKPSDYSGAARMLRQRGKLVWLPVDSSSTKYLSDSRYAARYKLYCGAAKPGDWVEVNEVNGPWTGKDSAHKAYDAISTINAAGLTSFLTLYVETKDDAIDGLWRWLDKWYAQVALAGVVGISYYPRQGGDGPIDDWTPVYQELGERFPRARLVFSEIGDEKFDDEDQPVPASPEETRQILSGDVGGMVLDHPRFEGGFFWWSFVTEMARGPFLGDYTAALRKRGAA